MGGSAPGAQRVTPGHWGRRRIDLVPRLPRSPNIEIEICSGAIAAGYLPAMTATLEPIMETHRRQRCPRPLPPSRWRRSDAARRGPSRGVRRSSSATRSTRRSRTCRSASGPARGSSICCRDGQRRRRPPGADRSRCAQHGARRSSPASATPPICRVANVACRPPMPPQRRRHGGVRGVVVDAAAADHGRARIVAHVGAALATAAAAIGGHLAFPPADAQSGDSIGERDGQGLSVGGVWYGPRGAWQVVKPSTSTAAPCGGLA